MTEYLTNTPVGVTHIWPYSKLVNPEAQPFSNEREADVWDELREMTFDEDMQGKICVALHSTLNHNAHANDFKKLLEKDDIASNRVSFFRPRVMELNIHRAATPEFSYQRVVEAVGSDGEATSKTSTIVIPAEQARDEKEARTIPFHLGSKPDAEFLINQHRNHEICALVLWHPDEP
jgi:hypothetical protein